MRHNKMAGNDKFLLPFSRRRTSSNLNYVKNLHGKSTYFYRWGSLLPITCGVALLAGLVCVVNPFTNEKVIALTPEEECEAGKPVLALDMSGETKLSRVVDDDVADGAVSYISKEFKVTSCRTAGYRVYVQANSEKLQNQDAPDALFGVGKDILPADFADNTWGYAVADMNQQNMGLKYNTIPVVSNETGAVGYLTTDNTGVDGGNLKVVFAAKLAEGKAAGHYTTDALISVVANAWDVAEWTTLGGITKMSEMTSAYCKSLSTPAVDAKLEDIPTGRLIDDREGEEGTKYWVAKLADGNCWMTQNMAYDFSATNKVNKDVLLVPHDKENPTSYTQVEVGNREVYEFPYAGTVYSNDGYDAHYRIGNTYGLMGGSACAKHIFVGEWDWKVPSDYMALLRTTYGYQSNEAGSIAIRKAPFFYLLTGPNVGNNGWYWTTRSVYESEYTRQYYYLSISTNGFTDDRVYDYTSGGSSTQYYGSVRCVVSGN